MRASVKLTVDIGAGSLLIGEARYSASFAIEEIYPTLGCPSRVDKGHPPAPVKHRNNWRYIYDDLGLSFTDHHATGLIGTVDVFFVIPSNREPWEPIQAFEETFFIDEKDIPLCATVEDVARLTGLPFRQALPWMWAVTVPPLDITLLSSLRPTLQVMRPTDPVEAISISLISHGSLGEE